MLFFVRLRPFFGDGQMLILALEVNQKLNEAGRWRPQYGVNGRTEKKLEAALDVKHEEKNVVQPLPEHGV